jgi:hypothetical protein
MQRVTLSRQNGRFDFSEHALESVDALNLTHTIRRDARDAATEEFMREVRHVRAKYNMDVHAAIKFVEQDRPRLFKMTRLEPVELHRSADIIVSEGA